MSIIEHVDPYRCYRYHPEASAEGLEAEAGSLKEYYKGKDHAQVMDELKELVQRSYQVEVLLGQRHFAPSPTWRDEYLMDHGYENLSRFAVRVHMFEKVQAGGSSMEVPGSSLAGRYLGFASLRPPGSRALHEELQKGDPARKSDELDDFRWVIEAELTCPAHMQRPRYHILSTTASSARLGVLPFRSTVYMLPNYSTPGSSCTHVALSQALHLVMGRFGSRPISQREFEMLLWEEKLKEAKLKRLRPVPYHEVRHKGATLWEALNVVRNNCEGGGFVNAFIPEKREDMTQEECDDAMEATLQMAHRCITDTLANGLPVVLHVNGEMLYRESQRQQGAPPVQLPESDAKRQQDVSHAVLLFGMRLIASRNESLSGPMEGPHPREDAMELPGRYVGHDTTQGPFAEWPVRTVLNAALAAYPPNERTHGIHLLALGPRVLKLGMREVRERAEVKLRNLHRGDSYMLACCAPYLAAAGVDQEMLDEAENPWRLVVRLQSMGEIQRRYKKPEKEPTPPVCVEETQFNLLHDELRRINAEEARASGTQGGEGLAIPSFWSVEVHWAGKLPKEMDLARGRVLGMPMLVMFFHAAAEEEESLLRHALLRWSPEGLVYQDVPKKGIPSPPPPASPDAAHGPLPTPADAAAQETAAIPEPTPTPAAMEPACLPATTHHQPFLRRKPGNIRAQQRRSMAPFPEVSLITSWHLPPPPVSGTLDATRSSTGLRALRFALEHQVSVLDLYFLDDSDVSWYHHLLWRHNRRREETCSLTALEFAAKLREKDVRILAEGLNHFVTHHYRGRLVGPRPRIAALATYWPHISVPKEWYPKDKRAKQSVKAVRNSILLAALLGSRHVEIVGGSALPQVKTNLDGEPVEKEEDRTPALNFALQSKQRAREDRHLALVKNLCAVYTRPDKETPGKRCPRPEFRNLTPEGTDSVPKLCLEVEPGSPFLIENVDAYIKVHRDLNGGNGCPYTASHVLLNVDIAHMMLCKGDHEKTGAQYQMHRIRTWDETEPPRNEEPSDENEAREDTPPAPRREHPSGNPASGECAQKLLGIKHLIGHMHVSDHARTHASDLTPGTYHFFHHFHPWLELAVELTALKNSAFSGVIAVEMETCADIHEAARAMGRIRRWLQATPNYEMVPATAAASPGAGHKPEDPTDPAAGGGPDAPAPKSDPPAAMHAHDEDEDAGDDEEEEDTDAAGETDPITSRDGEPATMDGHTRDASMIEAAIVVVDIGNSTKWALTAGMKDRKGTHASPDSVPDMEQEHPIPKVSHSSPASVPESEQDTQREILINEVYDQERKVASRIEKMVNRLCRCVHQARGSVLSFTGDGLVAVFDDRHFASRAECAIAALRTAYHMAKALEKSIGGDKKDPRTIRVALHWGRVYVPTKGSLRSQAIGRDVILNCRLCGWVKETVEQEAMLAAQADALAKDPAADISETMPEQRAYLACTGSFMKCLPENEEPHQPCGVEVLLGKEVFGGDGQFAPKGFDAQKIDAAFAHMLVAYRIKWTRLAEYLRLKEGKGK